MRVNRILRRLCVLASLAESIWAGLISTDCTIVNTTITHITHVTTTTTTATPSWMRPSIHSASLVTDVRQNLTFRTVNQATTTEYIVQYWEWHFHQQRTVTMLLNAPRTSTSQIQTWSARVPSPMSTNAVQASGGHVTYCYEEAIRYEETDYYGIVQTMELLSTITIGKQPASRMKQTEPAGRVGAKSTSVPGVEIPATLETPTEVTEDVPKSEEHGVERPEHSKSPGLRQSLTSWLGGYTDLSGLNFVPSSNLYTSSRVVPDSVSVNSTLEPEYPNLSKFKGAVTAGPQTKPNSAVVYGSSNTPASQHDSEFDNPQRESPSVDRVIITDTLQESDPPSQVASAPTSLHSPAESTRAHLNDPPNNPSDGVFGSGEPDTSVHIVSGPISSSATPFDPAESSSVLHFSSSDAAGQPSAPSLPLELPTNAVTSSDVPQAPEISPSSLLADILTTDDVTHLLPSGNTDTPSLSDHSQEVFPSLGTPFTESPSSFYDSPKSTEMTIQSSLQSSPFTSNVLDYPSSNSLPSASTSVAQEHSGTSGPATTSTVTPISSERTLALSDSSVTFLNPGPSETSSYLTSSLEPTSTTNDASVTATSEAPSTSPSSPIIQQFQLYVKNKVDGLNAYAVGKDGRDQIIIGVNEATILTINQAGNMRDDQGNIVFFTPKDIGATSKRSGSINHKSGGLSRFYKREDDDPVLEYGLLPPVNSVFEGFSLVDITLEVNTTQANYTFYTCDEYAHQQSIYVAEVGHIPEGCFDFDLVTTPPPLSHISSSSSHSVTPTTNLAESSTHDPWSTTSGSEEPSTFITTDEGPSSASATVISTINTDSPDSESGSRMESSTVLDTETTLASSSTSLDPTSGEVTSSKSSMTLFPPASSSTMSSSSTSNSLSSSTSIAKSTTSPQQSAPTSSTNLASDSSTESLTEATTIGPSLPASSVTVSPTIVSSTSSVSATIVQSSNPFANQGLYNDDMQDFFTGTAISTNSPNMYVDVCASFCHRFQYFGVENGDTCYCGSGLKGTPEKALDQSGASNIVCRGDVTQYCGGPNLLQLYAQPSTSSTETMLTSISRPESLTSTVLLPSATSTSDESSESSSLPDTQSSLASSSSEAITTSLLLSSVTDRFTSTSPTVETSSSSTDQTSTLESSSTASAEEISPTLSPFTGGVTLTTDSSSSTDSFSLTDLSSTTPQSSSSSASETVSSSDFPLTSVVPETSTDQSISSSDLSPSFEASSTSSDRRMPSSAEPSFTSFPESSAYSASISEVISTIASNTDFFTSSTSSQPLSSTDEPSSIGLSSSMSLGTCTSSISASAGQTTSSSDDSSTVLPSSSSDSQSPSSSIDTSSGSAQSSSNPGISSSDSMSSNAQPLSSSDESSSLPLSSTLVPSGFSPIETSSPSMSSDFTATISSSSPTVSSSESSFSSLSITTSSSFDQVAAATSVIDQSSYQPFCSAYLGYTTPVTTTTTTATEITSATSTVVATVSTTATSTVSATLTTTVPSQTTSVTSTTTATKYTIVAVTTRANQKRRFATHLRIRQAADSSSSALATPSALATFSPNILSSACSQKAMPVTQTSTQTSTTSTTATSAIFTTMTSTTTVATVTRTTTVSTQRVTSGISTTVVSTVTPSTVTITSTTTITYASGAPTDPAYYLQVSPDPNGNAGWGLSDPATHMTDNYFHPNRREVFELTSDHKLYSVTNNSWYGVVPNTVGRPNGKLWWDTHSQYGNQTWYGTNVGDGTGRLQLFLNSTAANAAYSFCVATVASADSNSATGFHIYFFSTASQVSACTTCNLYLSPIGNG